MRAEHSTKCDALLALAHTWKNPTLEARYSNSISRYIMPITEDAMQSVRPTPLPHLLREWHRKQGAYTQEKARAATMATTDLR